MTLTFSTSFVAILWIFLLHIPERICLNWKQCMHTPIAINHVSYTLVAEDAKPYYIYPFNILFFMVEIFPHSSKKRYPKWCPPFNNNNIWYVEEFGRFSEWKLSKLKLCSEKSLITLSCMALWLYATNDLMIMYLSLTVANNNGSY